MFIETNNINSQFYYNRITVGRGKVPSQDMFCGKEGIIIVIIFMGFLHQQLLGSDKKWKISGK